MAALTDWSAEETDNVVLAEVLHGLYSSAGPRAEEALLAYVGHHDAGVRRAVAAGLGTRSDFTLSDEAREALLVLMSDPDTEVRIAACLSVGAVGNGDLALTDAMAAHLDHPERRVQLVAVYGLALHNDERCVEGADRLGQPRPGFRNEEAGYLDAAWRYQWRRDHN
ncbi:hypothetical protein ACFQ8S_33955 [Streptomyces virginiae]|uniref:hypothetical protein n=1 Tax=Streptomyces virginiae TaxID=1961 RepID=UPI0036B82092